MFKSSPVNEFLDILIIKKTKRKKTISITIKDGHIIVLSPKMVKESYLASLIEKKKLD